MFMLYRLNVAKCHCPCVCARFFQSRLLYTNSIHLIDIQIVIHTLFNSSLSFHSFSITYRVYFFFGRNQYRKKRRRSHTKYEYKSINNHTRSFLFVYLSLRTHIVHARTQRIQTENKFLCIFASSSYATHTS